MKYRKTQKPIIELTDSDIIAWLADLPDKQIIRSIVLAVVESIREGSPREQRTLRGLWYQEVKPILSRLGVLNKKTSGENPVPWVGKLSVVIAELVRAGKTTYQELSVVDQSRRRRRAAVVNSPRVETPLVGGNSPWIILFSEKDTIYSEIQSLAYLYGVSAVSGKGQPAISCTRPLIREILSTDQWKESKLPITLLSMADYDPAGWSIANSQFNQIEEAVEFYTNWGVAKHVKIGILPDQLTQQEITKNKYQYKEPDGKEAQDWFAKTGGINGDQLGLELDALTLPRLREIFSGEIEKQINLTDRFNEIRYAYLDSLVCDSLLDSFQTDRMYLHSLIMRDPVYQKVQGHELPKDLLSNSAIEGHYQIDLESTADLFNEYTDSINEILEDGLAEI